MFLEHDMDSEAGQVPTMQLKDASSMSDHIRAHHGYLFLVDDIYQMSGHNAGVDLGPRRIHVDFLMLHIREKLSFLVDTAKGH